MPPARRPCSALARQLRGVQVTNPAGRVLLAVAMAIVPSRRRDSRPSVPHAGVEAGGIERGSTTRARGRVNRAGGARPGERETAFSMNTCLAGGSGKLTWGRARCAASHRSLASMFGSARIHRGVLKWDPVLVQNPRRWRGCD